MISGSLQAKYAHLQEILRGYASVAVAFSGGVDSTFVLQAAIDTLGSENVLAVTGISSSLASRERGEAEALASSMGARQITIDPGEFQDPNYLANPTNRCFYCKTALYTKMDAILAEHGLRVAVNGTNMDDLGDYRPGLAAANQHHVLSPCVEAGLTKADIRALSAQRGLPTADKPASPCLSSRVQYGEEITREKLLMIERAENFLHDLGIRECRVRHHENLARIEVPADMIGALADPSTRAKIDAAFREYGYQYVTLDLRGFRSGSMNEVIAFGRRQGI